MHHLMIDDWGRRTSLLHAVDARAKLLVTLWFLILVALATRNLVWLIPADLALLLIAFRMSGLPLGAALKRAAIVIPFCLGVAIFTLWAGELGRALVFLSKAYVSALAALLLIATTPLPRLFKGLESLGVPRFLLMVTQFIYRYLFVIVEQAQHMRLSGLSRGGFRLKTAAAAIAILFARSYGRAEAIHRAMLARGFEGHFPSLHPAHWSARDSWFVVCSAIAFLAPFGFTHGGYLK